MKGLEQFGLMISVIFKEPYQLVGYFLEGDARVSTDQILLDATHVANGVKEFSIHRGNSSTVMMTKEWVIISNQWEDKLPPVVVSMEGFLSVLRYNLSVVSARRAKKSPEDVPHFSFEEPEEIRNMSPDEAIRKFRQLESTG